MPPALDRTVDKDTIDAIYNHLHNPPLWISKAQCATLTPTDITEPHIITPLCKECPVQKQCLEWGTTNESTGIYGGKTLKQGEPT